MRKIALFGGSFDPIHNGHIELLRQTVDALALDGAMLIPSAVPPHKMKKSGASGEHRLAMCRLAVDGIPGVEVSDIELVRGGASFTVDTLTALHGQYPDTEWYFLCGADMFLTIGTWWRYEEILRLAVICTVPRGDVDAATLRAHAETLEALGGRCIVCDDMPQTVSSTQVRNALRDGASVAGLIPDAVAAYIAAHRLYTEQVRTLPTDEQIVGIISKRESPFRFRHSLAVADEAARLAEKYGADAAKARTCGLLHDIFKDASRDAQLQILKEFDIIVDEVTRAAPKLWHACAGAAFMEHILGFTDREMIDAVRYHTTARAGMCLLEKILYLADFTSADRDYPDVDVMRRLTDESIEAGMRYSLQYTIRELLDKGVPVHPDTLGAYNELTLHKGGTADG